MAVKLIWTSPDAEQTIAYCARVSNPSNQDNTNIEGLLRYCMKHGHWSVFEMASMCVEITTSRAISAQILRHKSFSFQEFSQRYAESSGFVTQEARSQDLKNRQNSIDNLGKETKQWWDDIYQRINTIAFAMYDEALKKGVAKECARMILPLATETKLYMSGTLRSWIHYVKLRTANGTQKEHMDIADDVLAIIKEQFPTIGQMLESSP